MVSISEIRKKQLEKQNNKAFKKKNYRAYDFDIERNINKASENSANLVDSNPIENEPNIKATTSINTIETETNNAIKSNKQELKKHKSENFEKINNNELNSSVVYSNALYTLKEKILIYLSQNLANDNTLQTKPIFISILADNCGSTTPSVKKTLQRLEIGGSIERVKSKPGQGGCTIYKITRAQYEKIKEFKI